MTMARRAAYQTRYHNKSSIYIVLGFLIVFAVVLVINCNSLREKADRLEVQKVEYEHMLKQEQQEALDLQELAKSLQTKESYAQIARERLGMVFKDEIVFKPGN